MSTPKRANSPVFEKLSDLRPVQSFSSMSKRPCEDDEFCVPLCKRARLPSKKRAREDTEDESEEEHAPKHRRLLAPLPSLSDDAIGQYTRMNSLLAFIHYSNHWIKATINA